ncbi:hypothetical protein ES703_18389 [subsurface metagenome]
MAEVFTVEQRGIGKPDYSKEVSAGRERRGLSLEYLQTLKIFTIVFTTEYLVTPYDWVKAPLAPGASASLIDTDTGDSMPFPVPLGYTATIIDFGSGLTEDAIMWTYMSGFLISNAGVYPGGNTYYENRIQAISTAVLDPTGALSLQVEFRVTNLGTGNLEGQIAVTGYLEAVGTQPLPLVKTVKCKWCGHKHTVPNETTQIICPQCGKLFIVYDLSKVRKA